MVALEAQRRPRLVADSRQFTGHLVRIIRGRVVELVVADRHVKVVGRGRLTGPLRCQHIQMLRARGHSTEAIRANSSLNTVVAALGEARASRNIGQLERASGASVRQARRIVLRAAGVHSRYQIGVLLGRVLCGGSLTCAAHHCLVKWLLQANTAHFSQ